MTSLVIDLDAIAANWQYLAQRNNGPTAAVVKADGYGLGAKRVAERLFAAGARHFFVAYPEEGAVLRPLLPGAMIAILNGLFPDRLGFYSAHNLAPVLGNLADIDAWRAHAAACGRALPALLHVDTGMNRLGLSPVEHAALIAEPQLLSGIQWLYVMTHLIDAELADHPRNRVQAARFADACAILPPMQRSLANSSGVFLGPEFHSDLARPGAAMYGINPTPGSPNLLRTVIRLSARVLQIREIAPGETVGYNAIWTAQRPTRVATVSAGYADGYHRALSNKAFCAFDGARLPLIGRVSMDLTNFDATDCPALRQGSMVELIGPAIPPDEVAGWAGTNGYEILTSLRARQSLAYAPVSSC